MARRAAAVSVVKKGLPGASRHDDHPAFLQVPHSAAANIGLGDLGHLDGSLHPGGLAQVLQHVLQRQRIDDCCQHAHVVALGLVDADFHGIHSPPDVAATHHHGDVYFKPGAQVADLLGDGLDYFPVNA